MQLKKQKQRTFLLFIKNSIIKLSIINKITDTVTKCMLFLAQDIVKNINDLVKERQNLIISILIISFKNACKYKKISNCRNVVEMG